MATTEPTTADLRRAKHEDLVIEVLCNLLDRLGVSPTLPAAVVREHLAALGLTVRKRLVVLVAHTRTVRALEQEARQ